MKFKTQTETTAIDFLIDKGVYHTKTKAKQIFQNGLVWVNDERQRNPSTLLQPGDTLEISSEKSLRTDNVEKQKFRIIYEDDHFLALIKNANFSVLKKRGTVPSMTNWVQDLVSLKNGKYTKCFALNNMFDGESGVLLYSKGVDLGKTGLELEMEYFALSDKVWEESKKTIDNTLELNKSKIWVAKKDEKDPKHITQLITKTLLGKVNLYQAFLTNPKQYQLRAHLMFCGIPAKGDSKYGSKSRWKRLGLHLYKLSFIHPETKERINLTAPKPKEFKLV